MRPSLHFLLYWFGMIGAETQLSPDERACVARHAEGKRSLVELGVWHGVTTAVMRSRMSADGVVHAVDPFPAGRLRISCQWLIARREVGKVRNGTVRWVRNTSQEAARNARLELRCPFDFILIDAEHTYEALQRDWQQWTSLLAVGGMIALHDSVSSATRNIDDAGSARFTRDVVRSDPRFELVEVVDTLSVLKRIV